MKRKHRTLRELHLHRMEQHVPKSPFRLVNKATATRNSRHTWTGHSGNGGQEIDKLNGGKANLRGKTCGSHNIEILAKQLLSRNMLSIFPCQCLQNQFTAGLVGRGYKLIEDELLNSGIDFGAAETNRGWTNLCIRSTDTETALLI